MVSGRACCMGLDGIREVGDRVTIGQAAKMYGKVITVVSFARIKNVGLFREVGVKTGSCKELMKVRDRRDRMQIEVLGRRM